MANSVDFRADQVQTSKIIVTGSTPQKTLLIYGIDADGVPANQGNIKQTVFPSNTLVGGDVFLYVSGGQNQRQDANGSIAVFGGDVVFSGAFYQGQPDTIKGGEYSHAEGYETYASGSYSHAEGRNTEARGKYSHAEGQDTVAIGNYSHAEGNTAIATGVYSHAEGVSTNASGDYSHTEGYQTTATGIYSHAEGYKTQAKGTGSLAAGLETIAYGPIDGAPPTTTQAAFGKYNIDNNIDSLFVVGDGLNSFVRHDVLRVNSGSVQVTGSLEVLGGITGSLSGTVGGLPFIVAGANITANYNSLGQWEITGSGGGGGTNFFTEIDSTNIFTTSSVALARLSASLGAEITGSLTQGAAGNIASGLNSHAEGDLTVAAGEASHAEGDSTVANGDFSHAEGFGTEALGTYSHAEGYDTHAFGTGSFAVGLGTIASGAINGVFPQTTVQAAFGKYNLGNNTDSLFVVGDGLDASNRHDVLRVNSGSVQVTGSLEVLGGITGSLSGTVAGYPFIVAGSNITANYNSLGQWEITGSGGVNFWTELDSTNIFTTSSVALAKLSASLGAEITGSVTQGNAGNVASGQNSHAEGGSTTASGDNSHAEGFFTTASGQYSHAEGVNTKAFGTGSLAVGLGTIASGAVDGGAIQTTVQAAFGKYNLENNTDSLFVVGDGLNSSNRHDVLRVNSGSVEVTGSLEVLGGITGSLNKTVAGNSFIVAGSNIATNYNSLGQWEITSSIQKINIAGYNRTNLTTPTVIGLAYYNTLEYQNVSNISLSAVGMNMANVSGGLDLYDQTTSTLVASLTWSGNSTLTTGSYQTTTFGIPALATTYELHFSQSGGANGGSDYSMVGFVNFVLS